MDTLEVIATIASVIFGGFGIWMAWQQSLIKGNQETLTQVLHEIKEERAAARAASSKNRERDEQTIKLTEKLITVVESGIAESRTSHARLIEQFKEDADKQESAHDKMKERLTDVLAHHRATK